ncbi:hypothetical protein RhiirB3_449372 [Rhizophagus irregularis]|nr:hypothetical protein RhiirB3_449372 [Rhizophagus irregularis]
MSKLNSDILCLISEELRDDEKTLCSHIVEQTNQTGKKSMSKKRKKSEEIEQMKQGNQDGSEEPLKPPSKHHKRAPVSTTRVTTF